MQVLLINPQTSWKGENGYQDLTHRNFNDHLGIRYVAASLEKGGHAVDIIDAHFEELPYNVVLERICSQKYEIYGISFVETIIEETFEIVNLIKTSNPEAKIIVGGYGATLLGERVLTDCKLIDAAILVEGEESTLELVNNIYDKASWRNIKGIMYAEGEEIIKTDQRKLIEEIDSIPWPKRADSYKYGRANIIASRGCYGSCTYCSITEFYKRTEGPRVRVRNPIKIVDEMEYMVNKYGIHHFDFVDDNFTSACRNNLDWAKTLVNEIRNRNLNISWGIQARANDIEEDLFSTLYKGGLRVVSTGIENDVTRVIKLLKTGTTKEIHRKAVSILRKLRIDTYIEMILLEPTATLEEIKENLEFLEEIKFSEVYRQNPITFTTKLHLYTGTPVVDQMKKLTEVYESGYHLSYKFADPKVEKLNQVLMLWQEKTADLATFQLSYLQYHASNKGLLGLAMKIIKLSKRYLDFDLSFYKSIIDFINNNPEFSQYELKEFMSGFEDEISYLRSEFSKAMDLVVEK